MIRDITFDDLAPIKRLVDEQMLHLPSIKNCISDKVVDDGNGLVAYGIVKNFAEAVIIVNENKPKISRARALKEFMRLAILGTREKGLEQLHVFVSDPNLAGCLEKHYGFKKTNRIVLIKDL